MAKTAPKVAWAKREGWQAFGNRLNFLSPERNQIETGKLAILPAKNPERRNRNG